MINACFCEIQISQNQARFTKQLIVWYSKWFLTNLSGYASKRRLSLEKGSVFFKVYHYALYK